MLCKSSDLGVSSTRIRRLTKKVENGNILAEQQFQVPNRTERVRQNKTDWRKEDVATMVHFCMM